MSTPDEARRAFLSRSSPLRVGKAVVEATKRRFTGTLDAFERLSAPSQPPAPAAMPRRPRPTMPLVRPPGAVREEDFLAHCSRCGECHAACPHGAIREAPIGFREAAGTPIIIGLQSPCLMCPDTPCIDVCPDGVLLKLPPFKMGTARIIGPACISSAETPCTACSDACPIEDVLVLVDGRPVVDVEACTGCGICQYVCPAPHNAIMIKPEMDRPAWTPPG